MSEPPSEPKFTPDKLDKIIQQEQSSDEKGQASVDATPEGLEASASVDVGRHATAGGFFKRTWKGAQTFGARFKVRW